MIVECRGCGYGFEPFGYRDAQCPVCDEVTPLVRTCPACEQPMTARKVGDVALDQCSGCGGVLLETNVLKDLLAHRGHARVQAVLAAVPRRLPPPAATGDGPSPHRCPTCGTEMARTLAYGSGTLMDVCRLHGTFVAAGALWVMLEVSERDTGESSERALQLGDRDDTQEGSAKRKAAAVIVECAIVIAAWVVLKIVMSS